MGDFELPHLRHNHNHHMSYMLEEPNVTHIYINTTSYYTTDLPHNESLVYEKNQVMYLYIPSVLIFLCIVSIAINVVILSSVFWTRGRISPTLHISLSLAGADTFTLIMFALGLTINSLLPTGLNFHYFESKQCFMLFIEGLRLGGIMTTMLHLLALAGNHYLGILSPLQYPSYMRRRNIHYCVLLLWVLPSTIIIIYFSSLEGEGFSTPGCPYRFLAKNKFRSGFSMVFFMFLLILIIIYTHIFALVRRHQESRIKYRKSNGTYSQRQANEKAILTTLLIVGSVIVGWLPAVIAFYLICDDCIFKLNWGPPILMTTVHSILQCLIICKNASNTYIYAFRMKEIKIAIKCMKAQVCGGTPPNRWNSDLLSRSSTRRTRRSVLSRLEQPGNGSVYTQRNGSHKSVIHLHSCGSPQEREKARLQKIPFGDSPDANYGNTSL